MDTLNKRQAQGPSLIPESDPVDIQYVPRNGSSETVDKLIGWLQSLAWVLAALGTSWYSNMAQVLLSYDERLRHFPLMLSFVGTIVLIVCTCLIWFKQRNNPNRLKENFLVLYPEIIYTMTATGILSSFMFILAIWPVWGWLSIPMSFVTFMGLISVPDLFAIF